MINEDPSYKYISCNDYIPSLLCPERALQPQCLPEKENGCQTQKFTMLMAWQIKVKKDSGDIYETIFHDISRKI